MINIDKIEDYQGRVVLMKESADLSARIFKKYQKDHYFDYALFFDNEANYYEKEIKNLKGSCG